MRRKLMEILACPMCRFEELELTVLREGVEVEEGVIYCPGCGRFYPIVDTIPTMLPDDLRERDEDVSFMKRWKEFLPKQILKKWSIYLGAVESGRWDKLKESLD